MHLCGSPYDEQHCKNLLYATNEVREYKGKQLDTYCVYCTANGKARKIGSMASWTGLTPKWCDKRQKAEQELTIKSEQFENKKKEEEKQMAAPTFNLAAFTSQNNQLKMIPPDMLDYNDDYERYDGEQYADMVESIKKNGILQPLIVSAKPDGRFYILAGNNRCYCGEAAGVQMFPCIVKENLTDEEAQAYIDETNVYQRGFGNLKISKQAEVIARRHSQMFDEKKLKAIQREIAVMNGEEVDDDEESGEKTSKLAKVGQEYGLSKDSIARLIRVNKLIDELKLLVDSGEIAIRTAVNLSYLLGAEQRKTAEMVSAGNAVDMKKSALLKELSAKKQLNDTMIEAIVTGQCNPNLVYVKPQKPKAFKIRNEIAEKYFAPDWDEDKVQDIIEAALEMYYNNSDGGKMQP